MRIYVFNLLRFFDWILFAITRHGLSTDFGWPEWEIAHLVQRVECDRSTKVDTNPRQFFGKWVKMNLAFIINTHTAINSSMSLTNNADDENKSSTTGEKESDTNMCTLSKKLSSPTVIASICVSSMPLDLRLKFPNSNYILILTGHSPHIYSLKINSFISRFHSYNLSNFFVLEIN